MRTYTRFGRRGRRLPLRPSFYLNRRPPVPAGSSVHCGLNRQPPAQWHAVGHRSAERAAAPKRGSNRFWRRQSRCRCWCHCAPNATRGRALAAPRIPNDCGQAGRSPGRRENGCSAEQSAGGTADTVDGERRAAGRGFSGPPSATPARYWQKSSWRKVPVSAGRPESARLPVEPGRWRALSSLPFRVRRSCRRTDTPGHNGGHRRYIWH